MRSSGLLRNRCKPVYTDKPIVHELFAAMHYFGSDERTVGEMSRPPWKTVSLLIRHRDCQLSMTFTSSSQAGTTATIMWTELLDLKSWTFYYSCEMSDKTAGAPSLEQSTNHERERFADIRNEGDFRLPAFTCWSGARKSNHLCLVVINR